MRKLLREISLQHPLITVAFVLLVFIIPLCPLSLWLGLRSDSAQTPEWTLTTEAAGTCLTVMQNAGDIPAAVIRNEDSVELSRSEAEGNADRAFYQLWKNHPDGQREPAYMGDMQLLNATLPNGEQRPVWARMWIYARVGEGNAEILYLDALTGDLLVHYTGATVFDPPFDSGCITEYNSSEFYLLSVEENVLLILILCPFTTGLLLMGTSIWWTRRRDRIYAEKYAPRQSS